MMRRVQVSSLLNGYKVHTEEWGVERANWVASLCGFLLIEALGSALYLWSLPFDHLGNQILWNDTFHIEQE